MGHKTRKEHSQKKLKTIYDDENPQRSCKNNESNQGVRGVSQKMTKDDRGESKDDREKKHSWHYKTL